MMSIDLWILASLFFVLLSILIFFLVKSLSKISEIRDLRETLNLMQQDIHQGLDSRQQELKETLKQTSESYLRMQKELGRLQEIGRDMKGLQEVLRSPKLRGNLGEQVMKDLLEEIIPKGRISCQYYFQSGEAVDAILKTENGLIPIDSKYSLESFRMMKKASEDDKPQWKRKFKSDIQRHIKSIAQKYIRPDEGTVDFAVMYLPSESVYYEILINHPDILEYSYQQRIYLVSPNTFYYFLKVIMVGLEGAKIEEVARGVLRGVQSLQLKTDKLGKRLQVLFGHVGRAYSTSAKVNQEYQQLTNNIRQIRLLKPEPPKKIKE